MNNLVSIGKAADQLGVCEETLRQWDREGKLVPVKTAGNHRRYRTEDIEKFCGVTSGEQKSPNNSVAVLSKENLKKEKENLLGNSNIVIGICSTEEALDSITFLMGGKYYKLSEILEILNENRNAQKMDKRRRRDAKAVRKHKTTE